MAKKEKLEDGPPSAFAYTSPSGQVEVVSDDGDGSFPYTLVLSRKGAPIEELRSEWWGEEGEYAAPWNETLSDLYSIARSAALGIDETIESMTAELRADDDIPF